MAAVTTDGDSTASQPALAGIPRASKLRASLWGALLVAAGLALEVLALSGWGAGRWPDVWVSVGAGALLAGFVMFLEPRLVRDVKRAASTTATEAAAREVEARTSGLDERLKRVEGLSDVQERVHGKRRQEAAQLADRLRGVPDYQDVFALLTDASSRSLFRTLWLRCGSDKSLLLNFTTAEMTRGDGLYVGWRILIMLSRLTNQPSRVAPRRRMRDVENVAEYVADPIVHSEWLPGESFEDAYRRFNESCERANVNARDVDFDEARARLVDSYETMVRSRDGGEDGSVRLGGSLALMVNDQWAVTFEATVMGIYGPQDGVHRLERVLDGQLYTTWPLVAADSGAAESCPEGYDTSYWEDALFYAQRFLPRKATQSG